MALLRPADRVPIPRRAARDRGERVCFELASAYLLAEFDRVNDNAPDTDREPAWIDLSRRVWAQVSECLLGRTAGRELIAARRSHRLRVAGYDKNPGEGLWWLAEDGALRA